ncbi:hypothetical protein SLA2020_203020 [Shorea laevis]
MQSVLLPKATCDNIDRLNRDFLWGRSSGTHKLHLVGWDVVCSEKKAGGLGLRTARDNNKAFVSKLGWRIFRGDNALWCQVLRDKYLRGASFFDVKAAQRSSPIWRGILQCRSMLRMGIKWRIGSGENIDFWKDLWVGHKPLNSYWLQGSLEAPPALKVAEVITQDKEWDLEALHDLVSDELVDAIRAIPLSNSLQNEDSMFWAGTRDGCFSVKSAYQIIQEQRNLQFSNDQAWSWIWRLSCTERIRMFVWLLIRGRVLTNSLCFAWHILSSPICPQCESSIETPLHLLRDCYFAKVVWGLLGFNNSEFFALDFLTWLKKMSRPPSSNAQDTLPRDTLFLSTIRHLWKARNALIFRSFVSRPQDLCSTIVQHARYTQLAIRPLHSHPNLPRWVPPGEGVFKLNTDGSYNHEMASTSAGGLIRDTVGHWISGFIVNIGSASVLLAELWGLREGLRLCRALNLTRVVAEMDSLIAVRLINEGRDLENSTTNLLLDIRNLMAEFEVCNLQHTLREGNSAADFLAALGHSSSPGTTILDFPPTGLYSILIGDSMGASFLRY